MENQINNTFSIKAKTCTLQIKSQEDSDTILGKGVKYVIPIYQRPYSWKDEQIRKFIDDIFIAYWGEDKNALPEPMFIGTMQLSEKQEIIDGQQRLTTFLLLFKVLKNRFPQNKQLNELNLEWLHTNVNSGKQQQFLEECLKTFEDFKADDINPYKQNAHLINEIFAEEISDEENKIFTAFNIDNFLTHLLTNIYFVVIETKAPLSKTLQIFNAINTTGLDLNGGDIFKIRMFEYLTRIEHQPETVFEDISKLYENVDALNVENKRIVTDIPGILGIYKYILISKFKLEKSLHQSATNHFYDLLFDHLLGNSPNKEFKGKDIKLTLAEISKLIDVRFAWEKIPYSTAEDASAMQLIWWSRYGRYWVLNFIYMFAFGDDENCWNNMQNFNRQLAKLYTIYSIRFWKGTNEMHRFTYELIDTILSGDSQDVINKINNKIGKLEHHRGYGDFENAISGEITGNAKIKNILCRLSAMLEEDYQSTEPEKINSIKAIFEDQVDVEHIEAYNNIDENLREARRQEWADKINSLGNLMILESSINRSISNNSYAEKKLKYPKSKYKIVQNQIQIFTEWDLEKCNQRKEKEVQKIIEYLFN